MAGTGVVDECQQQLMGMLQNAVFDPAFPNGYTGSKLPMIVPGYPQEQIVSLEGLPKTELLEPIISVSANPFEEDIRTFGDVWVRPNAGQGVVTNARRVRLPFLVTVWADQVVGGADVVRKIGGILQQYVLLNKNSLTSYRRLRSSLGQEGYDDAVQFWFYQMVVTGETLVSVDL